MLYRLFLIYAILYKWKFLDSDKVQKNLEIWQRMEIVLFGSIKVWLD